MRRVKCDEQKPVCARCIKAGRQCLGYDPWRSLTRKSQSPKSLVPFRVADADEDLHFRMFLEEGRKQSVVPGDVEFWKTLVPQLSENEPSIRYAALAIGAMLLQLRTALDCSKAALTYYNKSIQELLVVSTHVKKETALVSNVLFTCLECIQGHDTEALGLFHQGRRMFEEYWDTFGGSVPPSPITDGVRHLLARLRVLALLYGPTMADYTSPITVSPSVTPVGGFDSYEEARTAFYYLVGDIHELIVEGSKARLAHQHQILKTLQFERDALQARLHGWKDKFWSLLEPSLYTDDNIGDQIAVLTLQCSYIIISVWLACCLEVDEVAFDAHLSAFQRIISVSEAVIDLLDKSDLSKQPFSIELGLIAPLYMVGRKCRDPEVRRKVIELLRRGRKQEGLWQAKQQIQILQRVYEIEEAGAEWPEEGARLQATLVHPRRTSGDGRRGNTVQFFLRSDDPLVTWNVWEEWFEV